MLPFFPFGLPVAFGGSGHTWGWFFAAIVWVGYGLATYGVLTLRRRVFSWLAWTLLAAALILNVTGCRHGNFQ